MKERKLVWLNIVTGEFSESWTRSDHPTIDTDDLVELSRDAYDNNWKLIEFTCLNDEEFEFNNLMKIT